MAAVQLLARAIGREPGPYASVFVQDFNDTHGHAEVLVLLDKALVLAESEAAKEPAAPPEPPVVARSAAVLVRVPAGQASSSTRAGFASDFCIGKRNRISGRCLMMR